MSLDVDLAKRVREISDRSGRSMSFVIEKCVAGYLPVMENGEDEDTKGPTKKTLHDMIQEMFVFLAAAGMKPAYYRIDNASFRIVFDLSRKKKTVWDSIDKDFDPDSEDKRQERINQRNKKNRSQETLEKLGPLLLEDQEKNKKNGESRSFKETAEDAVNSEEKQDKPKSRRKKEQ
jgi:hypothetical protein